MYGLCRSIFLYNTTTTTKYKKQTSPVLAVQQSSNTTNSTALNQPTLLPFPFKQLRRKSINLFFPYIPIIAFDTTFISLFYSPTDLPLLFLLQIIQYLSEERLEHTVWYNV
jgi:hypothetical protein